MSHLRRKDLSLQEPPRFQQNLKKNRMVTALPFAEILVTDLP